MIQTAPKLEPNSNLTQPAPHHTSQWRNSKRPTPGPTCHRRTRQIPRVRVAAVPPRRSNRQHHRTSQPAHHFKRHTHSHQRAQAQAQTPIRSSESPIQKNQKSQHNTKKKKKSPSNLTQPLPSPPPRFKRCPPSPPAAARRRSSPTRIAAAAAAGALAAMETLMVDRVHGSLRLFMHHNAVFLCERLCAQFPAEVCVCFPGSKRGSDRVLGRGVRAAIWGAGARLRRGGGSIYWHCLGFSV